MSDRPIGVADFDTVVFLVLGTTLSILPALSPDHISTSIEQLHVAADSAGVNIQRSQFPTPIENKFYQVGTLLFGIRFLSIGLALLFDPLGQTIRH